MTAIDPLDPDEELLWRSLTRLAITLPRTLDDDLVRASGLSLTEYGALMNLSEATGRQLRMTDLASAMGMSGSRITRLVEDLQKRGLVMKQKSADDGRGNVTVLTDRGLQRLEQAYPSHLASARRHVLDHLKPRQVAALAAALTTVLVDGQH